MSMSRIRFSGLVLSMLFVAGTSAHALTLDEQRQFDKSSAYFTSTRGHAAVVQKNCGMNIPVKLDASLVTPFMAQNADPAAYCDEALRAIADECADAAGKKAVSEEIKSLSCSYGGKQGESSVNLANGDLQFAYGVDAPNLREQVKQYLDSKL